MDPVGPTLPQSASPLDSTLKRIRQYDVMAFGGDDSGKATLLYKVSAH